MKLKRSLQSILIMALISTNGCGTNQSNSVLPTDNSDKVSKVNNQNNYRVDLSDSFQGLKNGSTISVKVKFPDSKSFKSKYVVTETTEEGVNTLSVQTFRVNLCTDPARPFTTRVLTSPRDGVLIGRSDNTSAIIYFTNVPAGTYYATVSAFDKPKSTISDTLATKSEGIIMPNNGDFNESYDSPDTDAKIAVSRNDAIISSNNTLTFPNSEDTYLDIEAYIQIKHPNIEGRINPVDNTQMSPMNAS